MHIFFLKSLLALLVLCLSLIGIFTMFEVFGRTEKKYNIETLKKIHRLNGILFLAVSLVIAWLCIDFVVKTKAEPSARGAFHAVFAVSVIFILILKILFATVYRQFYGKLQTLGLILAFASFGMIGTSGGYYLLVTKFGTERAVGTVSEGKAERKEVASAIAPKATIKTDAQSIAHGKELYESKCYFCHDAYSTKKEVGPGHKGILKNPSLPVSGKPATPENIANQLRHPYKDMPSFSYLSDDEVQQIIAFLNTL
jgi:mono/diheme cytochrome c family protein